MNDPHSTAIGRTVTFRCSACSRCFVAVNEEGACQILCVCGAPLAPGPLPRGIYELPSLVPLDARITNPGEAPPDLDGGYGAAHGYGPSHGGPTGPSDTPAAATTTSSAAPMDP